SDARHYQIAALATLLIYNLGFLDFAARPLDSALAIAAALITQAVCTRVFGLPSFDPRSPLITGLSLSLLLRADAPWLAALAAASPSWTPAASAFGGLLATADGVWISPGQWGSTAWFAALVAFFAILVLGAARRADVAIFFLLSHAALLLQERGVAQEKEDR